MLGDEKGPTLAEMNVDRPLMRDDGKFRQLLRPVIAKTASKDEVDAAAKAVEDFAKKNKAFRNRLRATAKRIIDAGRLESYGTAHAQAYLQKWAKGESGKSPDSDTKQAK